MTLLCLKKKKKKLSNKLYNVLQVNASEHFYALNKLLEYSAFKRAFPVWRVCRYSCWRCSAFVHLFTAACVHRKPTLTLSPFPVPLSLPEDVNVSAVVAAVVVVCLVIVICSCGGFLLHRNGFFSRESASVAQSGPVLLVCLA